MLTSYEHKKVPFKYAYDVAIIGAGIGGLVAAIALKQQDLSVIVFEKAKKLENIGGAFALFPNGISTLKELDLEHIVQTLKVEIKSASQHAQNGQTLSFGNLDQPGGFYEQTGESLQAFSRSEFQQLLLEAVKNKGVNVLYGHECNHIKECNDGASVSFANGTKINAKYVLGADGIHSAVRKFVDPKATVKYAGICVFGGILEQDFAVTLEEFDITSSQAVSHLGEEISLWLCPIAGGRQSFYIHARLPEEEFKQCEDKWALLKQKAKIWSHSLIAKKIIQQIVLQGKSKNCFAVATHEINVLGKWISAGGHVVLTGDAAHGFSSKSGLATTLALDDALLFALCLKRQLVCKYPEIRQPIAKRFYEIEKDDENTNLIKDPEKIAQRDRLIVLAANTTPLWCELADILNEVSFKNQIKLLDPNGQVPYNPPCSIRSKL